MDFPYMVTFAASVPVILKSNKLTSVAQHTHGVRSGAGGGTAGSRMVGGRNCKVSD